jgi:pimeloyl-ACP methyl ester carboxylesterase
MSAGRQRPFRSVQPRPEPSRARYPDEQGFIERDGVQVFWERYGDGEPTLLLLPTWSIVHSRVWKAQIPYLARHFRVVTFDGRGIGKSDRPRGAAAYSWREFTADALAVMDASGTEKAIVVGPSRGGQWALPLAADHPERVLGAVFVCALVLLAHWPPMDAVPSTFEEKSVARRAAATIANLRQILPALKRSRSMRLFARRIRFLDGAAKFNIHYWRRDFHGFVEWFFRDLSGIEPHSTRQIESAIEWGLEGDPETLADAWRGELLSPRKTLAMCERVRCPVLAIHGTDDIVCPLVWAEEVVRVTGGRLVAIEGGDHLVMARHPVAVNLALREFAEQVAERAPSPPQAPQALAP